MYLYELAGVNLWQANYENCKKYAVEFLKLNFQDHISSPLFKTISQEAKKLGVEVYAVGGMVRDILLNRPNIDLDFVTTGRGIELAGEPAANGGVTTLQGHERCAGFCLP